MWKLVYNKTLFNFFWTIQSKIGEILTENDEVFCGKKTSFSNY